MSMIILTLRRGMSRTRLSARMDIVEVVCNDVSCQQGILSCSTSQRPMSAHVHRGGSRMVQAFMWQMHLKFIVLRGRDCLSWVVATTAAADSDSDSTSNQP